MAMIPNSRQCLVAVLAASAMSAASPVAAQTAAEFYKDRTITSIIGFSPGGGYNHYMRLLARHMPRHIPGNPSIVSRNMQGAGSLIAANFIYNTAPKDGSVIGIFASRRSAA